MLTCSGGECITSSLFTPGDGAMGNSRASQARPTRRSSGVTRRRFLVGTGSTLGALALPSWWTAAVATPRRALATGDHVPALVIGSGYGGAGAAARLAPAGHPPPRGGRGGGRATPGAPGGEFCPTLHPP